MVRIIHTGDMHFDSAFWGLPPEKAVIRRAEQRKSFLKIIEEARDFSADILLIAGDVFDGTCDSADTALFLRDAFARIKDVRVLIAPGNHDPLLPTSIYKSVFLGENVHIFGDKITSVQVGDAVVYGYGFSDRYVNETVFSPYDYADEDRVSILLMHGDILSKSEYNPLSAADFAKSGLDYIALGHVHSFSGFCRAGKTVYAYAGMPEGRYFDEPKRGGFIRGTVEKGNAELEFVPIGARENKTVSVDATGISSTEGLLMRIREKLGETKDLYKIELCGMAENTVHFDTSVIEKALSDDVFYCKIVDKTASCNQNAEAESYLEKVFRERLAMREDEIGRLALMYGLAALKGQKPL